MKVPKLVWLYSSKKTILIDIEPDYVELFKLYTTHISVLINVSKTTLFHLHFKNESVGNREEGQYSVQIEKERERNGGRE